MTPSIKPNPALLTDFETCFIGGYEQPLRELELKLELSEKDSMPTANNLHVGYWWPETACKDKLLGTSGNQGKMKSFIMHLAKNDGDDSDISYFDIYATKYLRDGSITESSHNSVNRDESTYNLATKIHRLAQPLKTPSITSLAVQALSREMLQSLEKNIEKNHHDWKCLVDLIQFHLYKKEPQGFKDEWGISYLVYLKLNPNLKRVLFENVIKREFPDSNRVDEITKWLTRDDIILFYEICAQYDPLMPDRVRTMSAKDREKIYDPEMFVNLPQNTFYEFRQNHIDEFLGQPVLTQKKKHRDANGKIIARTTINKYLWLGPTEVFMIDSHQPGPTTLVFSPHFHENNPRKSFHWTQNIPLQSGRVILLPEAYKAVYELKVKGENTNALHTKAFQDDGLNHIIVRRVEKLMGLVDGMIGAHDASEGPFFISDELFDKTWPAPSPYIPQEVLSHNNQEPAQVQWQIAEYSRQHLEKLTGQNYKFNKEMILDEKSNSADSATGYMNYHLRKPAMTFEGRKQAEHGQLHAMAIYTLLLGFGHHIAPEYEDQLKIVHPQINKELYVGLEVEH